MALTFSTSYRNARQRDCSLQEIFQGGELQLWSGTAPAVTAAATGSLLVACTLGAAARTPEIQATALLSLTGGAAGSVDTLTIDGYDVLGAVVPYNTSLTQTAADVATQINKFAGGVVKIWATSSGADITLRGCPGQGARLNGLAILCGCTTITNTINGASADNMGEGAGGSTAGVTAVNGLTLGEVASGVISIAGVWQGTVLVGSVAASYFRLEGCNTPTTTSAADTPASTPRYRIQGSCGVTGADLNMPGGTTLVASTPFTISAGTITEPAS